VKIFVLLPNVLAASLRANAASNYQATTEMASLTAPTPAPDNARKLRSKWAAWIILGGLLTACAMIVDAPVGSWLALRNQPWWQMFARCLSETDQWWMVASVGGLYGAFCYSRRQPGRMRTVILVTSAGLATGFCAMTLRFLVGRTRPNALVPQGFYGLWYHSHWIVGHYQFSSFPSGHTAMAVGLAAALWRFDRRAAVFAGLFAALVAWSRVALFSHHFSDVVAAAFLGVGCARLMIGRLGLLLDGAARWFRNHGRQRDPQSRPFTPPPKRA
jgi:membrane-associated phospholipid phosphatase